MTSNQRPVNYIVTLISVLSLFTVLSLLWLYYPQVVFNPSKVLNFKNAFVWSTCYIRMASLNLERVWGLVYMCLYQFLLPQVKALSISY